MPRIEFVNAKFYLLEDPMGQVHYLNSRVAVRRNKLVSHWRPMAFAALLVSGTVGSMFVNDETAAKSALLTLGYMMTGLALGATIEAGWRLRKRRESTLVEFFGSLIIIDLLILAALTVGS